MHRHLKLLVCLPLLASALFAQSEQLNPSSGSAVSVGRGRPMSEQVGHDNDIPVNPVIQRVIDAFDRGNIAQGKTSQQYVERILSAVATIDQEHNFVNIMGRHADGTVFYSHTAHNLRTNAGANWQADIMANTSTPSVNAQCNYIALTNDATAPGATDTTLTSEIAANGLSRAQGTYAHTSNATSYTVAKTFTATGTQASQKTGLFTASSSGTMCFENTYTAVTVNNTDTLTVTWTINF